jgi:hypothetical protein
MEEVIMLHVIESVGKFGAKGICANCRSEYNIANKYDAKKSRIGDLCNECKTLVSKMGEVTQLKLRSVYNYCEDTGELTYRVTTISGMAGELSTSRHSEGYLSVCINRKSFLAHRAIFLYMTGKLPMQIDHINHIRDDNRWCNLRNVESRDNQLNMSLSKNSTSGINGVSFHKQTGKYRAYIMINRKQIHLGMFIDLNEAKKARKNADIKYKFHHNHGS